MRLTDSEAGPAEGAHVLERTQTIARPLDEVFTFFACRRHRIEEIFA